MNIADMQRGERGRILRIQAGEATYRQKLLTMGLLPGTEFEITQIAAFGDPIEISIRGYHLSLRRLEAAVLQIEKLGVK